MIRWMFRRPATDVVWTDADFLRFTRSTVADLRASYARYPGDQEIESLVGEMLALSPLFAEMWSTYDVEVRGPMLKRIRHPRLGLLEFECQVLHIAETGQRIIAYCAAPGSADRVRVHRAGRAARGRLVPRAASVAGGAADDEAARRRP